MDRLRQSLQLPAQVFRLDQLGTGIPAWVYPLIRFGAVRGGRVCRRAVWAGQAEPLAHQQNDAGQHQ
jgi:hypothetical protein